MDVEQMLSELRQEYTLINELIIALERLAGRRSRRVGRPPNWLKKVSEQPSIAGPKEAVRHVLSQGRRA
jgi:hypothetical protein